MVRLRLKKTGRAHQPYFRIVAADKRAARDGREIEVLGSYNPREETFEKKVTLNAERIRYWLSVGAQPSDTVAGFIKRAGIKKVS